MRKKKFQANRIFTLNNPLAPRISPELAKEIGLNESILLLQLEFWIVSEGVERDGFVWLRRTVRQIQDVFEFWGVATIERAIGSLLRKGYLVAAQFDPGSGKSARWLRFDFERLATLSSIGVDCSTSEQPMFHSDRKSPQNGTIVLNIDKDKEYIPSVHKKSPKPVEPKALYPPEDFEIVKHMRDHLAERFITYSDAELVDLTDSWRLAKNADNQRPKTLWQWQNDWLRYVCAAWANRSRNGNGHKRERDDGNDYHSSLVGQSKPVDYFEKISAEYQKK